MKSLENIFSPYTHEVPVSEAKRYCMGNISEDSMRKQEYH
jgi:hypothetical protein